jgi:LysM repeat protein
MTAVRTGIGARLSQPQPCSIPLMTHIIPGSSPAKTSVAVSETAAQQPLPLQFVCRRSKMREVLHQDCSPGSGASCRRSLLNWLHATSIVDCMKRIFFAATLLALCAPVTGRTQDAATEERLKQLAGKIEDLIAGQEAQRKQISNLAREIESLRDQQNKPNTSYASQDDLKRLGKAIEEVDRKRMDDYEKIGATLEKIKKTLETPIKTPRIAPNQTSDRNPDRGSTERDHSGSSASSKNSEHTEKGFDYTVQSGDTLSAIIAAYKEKGIRVSEKQIMAANPALVPEKMKVGQKIWIPAPEK